MTETMQAAVDVFTAASALGGGREVEVE